MTAAYRRARRLAVALVGSTVLALGVLLVFLPGPAFVVIPVGLAILAVEFAWARRWLARIRDGSKRLVGGTPNEPGGNELDEASDR
ncbi:MAG: hypothetical protein HKP30_07825 [Myxococcales bacterium]|nr:hypothetical protein [Myxococcales bacterium]